MVFLVMLKMKMIEDGLYQKIREVIPTVCVDLIVTNVDGFYLLGKRTERPAQGLWWFPGGRIFKWEEWRDTALRKGQEELGVDLDIGDLISVENYFATEEGYHTVNLVAHAKYYGSLDDLQLDKSHAEYKWVNKVSENMHPCVKNPLLKFGFN